jgi:hypothetical protein
VYGPFISEGQTVSGRSYQEMLSNWLIPQLATERHDHLFQQDVAPPHWHISARTFLNERLPNRWIGRARQNDQVFCKWPPRSPDLTVTFSFGGTRRTESMYLHYPQTWMSCKNASLQLSTRSRRISCGELNYCIDVCPVTRGGHTECCNRPLR